MPPQYVHQGNAVLDGVDFDIEFGMGVYCDDLACYLKAYEWGQVVYYVYAVCHAVLLMLRSLQLCHRLIYMLQEKAKIQITKQIGLAGRGFWEDIGFK